MALQELQVNNSTSPPTQHFANVSVGQYAEITIVLKNSTSPSISISGNVPSLSAPFSVQSGGGAFTLAANGNTKNVVIRFTPTASGFQTATLAITHNAPLPTSPLNVDFDGTGIYLFEQTRKTGAGDVKVLIYGTSSFITAFTNCDLKKIDPLEVGFIDQDETLFFPSGIGILLRDLDRTAFDRLSANKDTIEVYLNGSLEYVGVADILRTEHYDKEKETQIVVFDEVNTLKGILLKDPSNNAMGPFGYLPGEKRTVIDLVTDIFKQINAAMSLSTTYTNDWTFRRGSELFSWSQIYYQTDAYFFGAVKPFTNVAELLRYLCDAFGCFAGMTTRNNAFFYKRFARIDTPTSLTGNVKSVSRLSNLMPKVGVRILKRFADGAAVENNDEGTVNTTPDGNLSEAGKVFVADQWSKSMAINEYAAYYAATGAGGILDCKDDSIDGTYRSPPAMMSKFYYTYRNLNRERWELMLYGVGFSILGLYSYDSKTLRPVKVVRDFEKNETKMTVVNIT